MSLYSALRSGVSGMAAQSNRLAAISDNIANVNTVGYKRAGVDFSAMVTAAGADRTSYTAGGVQSNTRYDVTREGSILGTNEATDIAVDGGGFFVVAEQSTGTTREFGLTRAGSFRMDDEGYLRNTAGVYLQGIPLNADGSGGLTGAQNSFANLETVRLGGLTYGASPSTTAEFTGNLPAQATTGQTFTTTTTVYDGLGTGHDATVTWTKNANADEWDVAVTATGYTVSPANATVTFTATGANAGLPSAAIGDVTLTRGTAPDTETVTVSFPGVTQYTGDYVPRMDADGASAAQVSGYTIKEDGTLWATFDNGASRPIYQIPVANVRNPDGLVTQDGSVYTLGADAGELTVAGAGKGGLGNVAGSSLEQSTVDMATELVSLIETQRAYSSNATTVRTADEMMEETTRLKR